ncbi:MAG: DPP IV N-terminal domain-containing protein [Terracidiphilus sp.]
MAILTACFSRYLIVVLSVFAFTNIGSRLAAQNLPVASPVTIDNIVVEHDRYSYLPSHPSWNPDGKTLSYIRTFPATSDAPNNAMTTEIWGVDIATGTQKLLVSDAEIAAAFGYSHTHRALGDKEKIDATHCQLQNELWVSNSHTLLLTINTSLARFDLSTHQSHLLISGRVILDDPQISPNGRYITFLKDHSLWLLNAVTGAAHIFAKAGRKDLQEGEPDWVYSHELGMTSAYWWSPDSSSIAWIETDDRAVNKYTLRNFNGDEHSITYPKPGGAISIIHLYVRAVSGKRPLEIDLGSDVNQYITHVQWLPDGKGIAIERLSRDQKIIDLLLADTLTGKVRTILSETDPYWVNLSSDLYFFKDSRRFLWSSERTGYRHLYLYDISGHLLTQVTHGDWEVSSLASVNESTGEVYFIATEASPLERQLYRVKLTGSNFARITREAGTHDVLCSPYSGAVLDSWSSHTTAPRQQLIRFDGGTITSLSNKISDDLVSSLPGHFEFMSVQSHLSVNMNAWMMKPPDFNPAKQYPVILYVAGGPGEQIVRDTWGGDRFLWFALMAQQGYIVFAVDNRGTTGRGHLFEEPLHLRFSSAEMSDQRDGVQYLRTMPWVDKKRIGICGWGYGGFLVLHGMLDRPLLFKAGFAGSPITDWHLYDAVFTERYLGDPVKNQDGWLSSSPLDNAKNLSAPLMVAQATTDETVHQENTLMLLNELLVKGKYADILLFPNREDLLDDRGSRQVLFRRLTDFFVKNL